MVYRQKSDKVLTCKLCGDGFVFTAGEQELFLLRGVAHEPNRCPLCARRPLAMGAGGKRR